MFKVAQVIVVLVFVFQAFLLTACKDETIHIDENFVATFVEMRTVEQMYGSASPVTRLVRKEILEKHGYNRESFKKDADEILADPDKWVPFQTQVVARIDSILDPETYLKKKEEEAKAKNKKKSKVKVAK
ncbi:MAG: hypothetical protein MJY82_10120 [Fibrobacter sp.]|nr:hypothetical protein [Fibrobacter sp.]